MKKVSLFLICLVVAISSAIAQKTVALQSNGTTTIFSGDNSLIDAYNASVSGDTIYMSGGNFDAPATIDKGLVMYGAGYHADSTAATQKTYLMYSNSLTLGESTSNLYMEGIEFERGLYRLTQVAMINFTFMRCKFNGEVHFEGIPNDGAQSNASFIQCDFGGILFLNGITYSVISNCILRGQIKYSNTNVLKNNIITVSNGFGTLQSCVANTFKNNIFSGTNNVVSDGNCNSNNFQYNLFASSNPILQTGATDLNNHKEIDMATVFVDAANSDFHLLSDASTTYQGDDGIQVGLYGGLLPFKDGAVPSNPHIIQKSISTSTATNGYLNISVKVSAQQN